MPDAVLHIGFSKTGSSSLQAFLSQGGLAGTGYEYAVIDEDGSVASGETLRQRAMRARQGYVASRGRLDGIDTELTRKGLAAIRGHGRIPVLSSEGWSGNGAMFRDGELLREIGISDAHAIAYVRPQVGFLNSGWWQWWAWKGEHASPEDMVHAAGTMFMEWARLLDAWATMPRVTRLTVRLHGGDTVSDFAGVLGARASAGDYRRVNDSKSRQLVQFYRAVPGLRQVRGAVADAVFAALLDEGHTPWIVPRSLAKEIVEACRADNERLMEHLDPAQRDTMAGDARWWDAAAWPEAEALDQPSREELQAMLRKVGPELLALARRLPANPDATGPQVAASQRSTLRRAAGKARRALKHRLG